MFIYLFIYINSAFIYLFLRRALWPCAANFSLAVQQHRACVVRHQIFGWLLIAVIDHCYLAGML